MFLYIFEDGTVGKSSVSPLPEDLQAIDQGVLQVIEFADGESGGFVEVTEDGGRCAVQECKPGESGQYHEYPSRG
jgi:hypothetical protein